MAKQCGEYLADYDFLIMMLLISCCMNIVMSVLKLALPEWTISQTNLSVYFTTLAILAHF